MQENSAQKAKNFIRSFEVVEDLEMMAHAKYGDSRRAHDFVRVDLPLMIEVAEGRDPSKLPDLSSRQKALLELSPADMAERIEADRASAQRVLGWSAPLARDEARDFVTGQDSFTRDLQQGLVADRQSRSIIVSLDAYTNSKESPLGEDHFSAIVRQEARSGYFRPGDEAILAGTSGASNPFLGEKKRIAEVQLSQVGEDSPAYYSRFRFEGERDFHNRGQLLDPRGTQHGYGVIAEADGKLFYVQTESAVGPVEEDKIVAREIVGVEKAWVDRISEEISQDQSDRLQNGTYSTLDLEGPLEAPRDMRGVLNMTGTKPDPTAGEFTYHPVDGPTDMRGPIIIEANSWQSRSSDQEESWARQAIRAHLEKYERHAPSMSDQVAHGRAAADLEPRLDKGQQAAALAAMQSMGR